MKIPREKKLEWPSPIFSAAKDMPTRPLSHLLTAIRQLYRNLGYKTYRIRSPWHRGIIGTGSRWEELVNWPAVTLRTLLAFFNRGLIIDGGESGQIIENASNGVWRVISRLNGHLSACTQDHTPFNVMAWHGTCCPCKSYLAHFCVMIKTFFDHHDAFSWSS
ncbi:hypothetical protein F5Y01DRAFT_145156 [Xylaria sp. FL0043]|nr:hypothetical protein F5Y01DRAFT_145156 [Xylaria sp. FL0043]